MHCAVHPPNRGLAHKSTSDVANADTDGPETDTAADTAAAALPVGSQVSADSKCILLRARFPYGKPHIAGDKEAFGRLGAMIKFRPSRTRSIL